LEAVYEAVLIDAIMVKIRDGSPTAARQEVPPVRNRPIHAAIGVDLGHKDIRVASVRSRHG
jgi:hypothetical protein